MSSTTSTTTDSTTLIYDGSTPFATVYTQQAAADGIASVYVAPSVTSTILPEGFVLYLEYSASIVTDVNVTSLIQNLGSTYPSPSTTPSISAYSYVAGAAVTTPVPINTTTDASVGPNTTLYIPITNRLPAAVSIASLVELMSKNKEASSSTAQSPTSVVSATRGSSQSSSASGNVAANQPTSSGVSHRTFTAALAGGTVGAFIAGLIICALIAFFCFRRRPSRKSSPQPGSRESSSGIPLVAYASSKTHEPEVVEVHSDLIGWQKHLPQEKDDRAITKTFDSIFDQIRMHIEGYYESESDKISGTNIATLSMLSSDDFPEVLQNHNDARLLLEGTLVRWIVHRISGRSDIGESLLPLEFIEIPKKNQWHMEHDKVEDGAVVETKKRGFAPALSQWRRLSGFLSPNLATDPAFRGDLELKIDSAVRTLTEAFLPWQSPKKKQALLKESLSKILLQASDAGILLFTQPSTFMFDWSSKDRVQTVAITPALVKRLDESATTLRKVQVLLEARRERV